MVHRQDIPVHGVDEERVVLEGLGNRHGPLDLARVQAGRHHVHGVLLEPRPVEDLGERHPGPLGDPVRAESPLRSLGRLPQDLFMEAAPVARALDVADDRGGGEPQDVIVGQLQGACHPRPLDLQPPGLDVDHR